MTTSRVETMAALSGPAIELITARFRVLAEPLRLRLLHALQHGEKTVSELVEVLGASQPNVSKHLRLMQDAGVVGRRPEGNLVHYFIADRSVIALCNAVCASVEQKLAGEVALAAELRRATRR